MSVPRKERELCWALFLKQVWLMYLYLNGESSWQGFNYTNFILVYKILNKISSQNVDLKRD